MGAETERFGLSRISEHETARRPHAAPRAEIAKTRFSCHERAVEEMKKMRRGRGPDAK